MLSQTCLQPGIYDMWLETSLAKEARAGQFICVYPKCAATLLPRPISICEVREDREALRIVYRVAGQGTAEFSTYKPGEAVAVMGTLGNGFPTEQVKEEQTAFLFGGGIGIPPMLELAKALSCRKKIIVGYRDNALFLLKDLERYGEVIIATEDGSAGIKGNVLDAIAANLRDEKDAAAADVIYACGPMPMLRAIKGYAQKENIPAYISLEERMACGVGACLGCVCRTKEADAHSHVHNARICTDGPVFEAGEVEI